LPAGLHVALTPPAAGALPASACAVAIDVLRATTTLAVAKANGCGAIVPFAGVREALRYRDTHPGSLACGEREGRIVPGFDLGNSPSEYTRERVGGRTLAFASTNGSRALLAASRCRHRLLGSFVNLSATIAALPTAGEIWLVCAGKLGAFAIEDAACAGTLAAALAARGAALANAEARLAATLRCDGAEAVRAVVEGCDHGRWLATLGERFALDVQECGTQDAARLPAEF